MKKYTLNELKEIAARPGGDAEINRLVHEAIGRDKITCDRTLWVTFPGKRECPNCGRLPADHPALPDYLHEKAHAWDVYEWLDSKLKGRDLMRVALDEDKKREVCFAAILVAGEES